MVPITNSSKQIYTTTINSIDEKNTIELSTGLYTGGVTSIQVEIEINSQIIQSGVLREGDKLLFCIPEATSGQSLNIYAKTTINTQSGDVVVIIRYSNGPSVCIFTSSSTSITTTTPSNSLL